MYHQEINLFTTYYYSTKTVKQIHNIPIDDNSTVKVHIARKVMKYKAEVKAYFGGLRDRIIALKC